MIIATFFIFAFLFLMPFLLGILLFRGRLKPSSRRLVFVFLGISLLLDIGFVGAATSGKLARFRDYAFNKRDQSLSRAESDAALAEEFSKYTTCLTTTSDNQAIHKCKEELGPEARAKLNANGDGESEEDMGEQIELAKPSFVDCTNPETKSEKTICSNAELLKLHTRVRELEKQSASSEKPDWTNFNSGIKTCGDDLDCLRKTYKDQIYRLTH